MTTKSRLKARTYALGGIACLLLGSSMAVGQDSEETIPFETIVKYSVGPNEPLASTVYVVNDRQEWRKIWRRANYWMIPKPPLPEIDFSMDTVIAVFVGYSGGSCNTAITRIVKSEDGLKVLVKESCPGPTCGPQPGNVTKPVEIVQTEKIEKRIRKKEPLLQIDFEYFDCKPPS